MWILTLWRGFFLLTPPDIRFGDTTFRGYYGPLRTLNVELLLIRPLWGRNVRQTCAVLNGILHGPPLNASALMVPKTDIRLLQEGKIRSLGNGQFR